MPMDTPVLIFVGVISQNGGSVGGTPSPCYYNRSRSRYNAS